MTTQDMMFPAEDISKAAQGNVVMFILTTSAFLKERGIPVEEWVRFVGNKVVPSWTEVQGKGARIAMYRIVRNMLSSGARLDSIDGDEHQARAVLVWPPEDILRFLGYARDDTNAALYIFAPVAEYLGFQFEMQRDGEYIELMLRKA